MSREIKFRLRIAGHDGNVQVRIVTLKELCQSHPGIGGDYAAILTKDEYTGLKDKNGKEIYGGDVLSDGDEYVPSLSVVEWNSRTARWTFPEGLGGGFLLNESYEVAGNIYENPELIGGGRSDEQVYKA